MIPAVVIDALAVARLTRLVTRDRVAGEFREAWIEEAYRRDGRSTTDAPSAEAKLALDVNPPLSAYFIRCPWCVSMWIALWVVALRRVAPRLWHPVATALAMSQVAGLTEAALLSVDTAD